MFPSPVSGTSPSSPVNSVRPLPPPPASSAASSPSAPLASPISNVVPPAPMVLVMPSGGEGDDSGATSGGASGAGRRSSLSLSLGAAGESGAGVGEAGGGRHGLSASPAPSQDPEEATTPLLSRYDPYHGVTCFVHHPFTQKPLVGEEVRESLQRALTFGGTQMSARLNHHDLAPTIRYADDGSLRSTENFRDLLERGNKWLTQNPQYSVSNCESVTWWTTEQMHVGDTEAVLLDQSPHGQHQGDTIYLTGLRLWVLQREQPEANAPAQLLRVRDFHPTEQESLSHLVKRVNAQLEESPCPGTIMTIETVPYADVSSRGSDVTVWRESQCKQGIHTLFLRIFYIEGQTKQETIGVRDFCPELNPNGSDPFGNLVKSAKRWVNEEKNIKLINLRSVFITRDSVTDSPEESADRTNQRYFQFDIHQYFTVLRVFFVRRPRSTSNIPYQLINYVTFTPVQLLPGESTEVEYEKMRQTMVRACAWIKAAGAEILCCESVITPLYAHLPTQTLPEITHWEPTSADSQLSSTNVKKYLLHVRLYLEGEYREPNPQALPPLPASLTAALQATLLDRERRHYRRKRKRRKRRRNIMIVLSAIILSVIIGIIVVDQSLNFFGL